VNPDLTCDSKDCPFEGEPRDRRGWHLERSIGLDVVIAFLALMFSGLAYVIHEDTRVTKVEDRATALEQADIRIEKSVGVQKDDLVRKVDRIEEKLDRLMERRR